MNPFVILSVLLVLLAGVFIVPTLWRRAPAGAVGQTAAQRPMAIGLLLALGVFTGGLYALVGQPQGLNVAPGGATTAEVAPSTSPPTPEQIEGMVSRLAQRLQAQPDDPAGWRMLARSYETLGRFDLAVQAYQRLMALQPPDADLLTDFAVTLGMSQGQTLVGEPEAVIHEALKRDPRHIQALALSGSAAFERRDYKAAVTQWEQLLSLVPKAEPMRGAIEDNVRKARSLDASH